MSGYYALGSDIDASATSGWTANQGLVGLMPLGNTTTAFTGQFAGLGHVISNLTVNYKNNSDIGLFGVTGTAAVVRDVGLSGGAVVGTDYVGPLVGFNQGTVLDSDASATGNDQHYLGGLVGENSGTITGSYATGALTSLNKITGGLVGINNSGGGSSRAAMPPWDGNRRQQDARRARRRKPSARSPTAMPPAASAAAVSRWGGS